MALNIYFYSQDRPAVIGEVIKPNKSGFHGSNKGMLHNRLLICVSFEHCIKKEMVKFNCWNVLLRGNNFSIIDTTESME